MNSSYGTIGRWSEKEHVLFMFGLKHFGHNWRKISKLIQTRTPDQVRTHAQKHERKSEKVLEKLKRRVKVCKSTQCEEPILSPPIFFPNTDNPSN